MSVNIKDRKSQNWERYLEESTPKFEELFDYCQQQQRVVPFEWGLIMRPYYRFASRIEFTKFPGVYI